ncbi:hypothetical protein NDU88_003341 [Pleurodeles waltl]|uniref:Uncharacterized protein n=1 Tax=Pleurodeles waltl TaxID=8319 RepID=A0AAV7WNU1_PLEWA|nr:hypothetical protein NDU88_003341 [Pleurodeles waltl]
MPGGRSTGKPSGKPAQQLLFSEALQLNKLTPSPAQSPDMVGTEQATTVNCILQEITAVSRRLEGMDIAITSLTSGTKSMRLDIMCYRTRTLNGDRGGSLTHKQAEGTEIPSFLRSVLPQLTEAVFEPPLEFQRAHHLGPKRKDGTSKPRPIIACLLRCKQVRQLLSAARAHGPFKTNGYEIRKTADFSRETNEPRKEFLTLRPRIRKLEVKYGLFEPARLWTTKNGVSKNFYDPEGLRMYIAYNPCPWTQRTQTNL